MQVAEVEEPDFLGEAVTQLVQSNPQPFFVQVGGFDGVSFDPLRRQIVDKNLSGLIVEPIPQYFEKLKTLYAGSAKVIPVNCAVAEEDGERTIWKFNPVAVERGLLPPHFAGISSFLMDDLLKETGVLGRSSPNPETTAALRSLLQAVKVPCRTMNSLLADYGIDRVDILQVDTEGYDYIILKLFDFNKFKPAIVHYEHQHLSMADREAAEALLRSHGYALKRNVYDTLAVHDRSSQAAASRLGGLKDLASSLLDGGRRKDALLLLDLLAETHPSDPQILCQLARLLSAEGRSLEAIEKLSLLKGIMANKDALVDEIRQQMLPAVQHFNDRLAAGDVIEAERYAAALTALIPGNAALLNAALSCNLALGRKDKAATYARNLLALDASHASARAFLDAYGDGAGTHIEASAPATPVPAPSTQTHPLIRLRDLHDKASGILCRKLDDEGVRQVETILGEAKALVVSTEPGSEFEAWKKHYRLMLDAVDLAAVQAPTPQAGREADTAIVTAAGTPLTWETLQQKAARIRAKTVFFAAADQTYIDLYAGWYIRSILKYCDVPCLIVVHVIGGKNRLKEIAKAIDIRDPRLVFTGDSFAADSITTRCYDAPPKGRIAKPVAHLQSIRFLRAGTLLKRLKLPLFVSDIDLILQRGVANLLQRCSGADVVLNENAGSPHAGSRLTANLLLLNPSENTGRFLRFLKTYLERTLAKDEVSRWIDQLALLLARHHLTSRGDKPRIEYFDTNSDINNVMYKSYQQHPFRFLSLYHGFDTSSLANEPVRLESRRGPKLAAAKASRPGRFPKAKFAAAGKRR